MKAVITQDLSKIYTGGKKAVNEVCITLEQGEVFGFLGPNGAGKTTTVKLLNGTLTPTAGTCRVFDIDPFVKPEQVHQFSGVVTEHAQMYDNLTGFQNLVFYGTLFGANTTDSAKRALALLDQLELTDAKDRKLVAYSTGMRQRLSLARAMMHRPKMLFLDEPTAGLDPESVHSVNNMIKRLSEEEGVTVFLCTHQLRYAQEICSSYGLIDNGVLLAAGSLDELRSLIFSGMTVSIETDRFPEDILSTFSVHPTPSVSSAPSAPSALPAPPAPSAFSVHPTPSVSSAPSALPAPSALSSPSTPSAPSVCSTPSTPSSKTGKQHYEINVQTEDDIPFVVKRIIDGGGSVYHVSARRLSLEEIYFSLLEKRNGKKEVRDD